MSEQRDARGPNPLRRTSDRIEAWSFFLTVMTMLLVAPWAAWSMAGHTFRADEQATEWERQHRFQVAAVLLEDAATPAEVAAGAGAPSARARWTGPDGVVRTATIPTQPGQRAGHTEPIWVNEQGATVAAPPRRNPMARAILSGLLTAGGVAGLLTATHRIVRWRLDRRRMHDWEAQWLIVEPRWSHR